MLWGDKIEPAMTRIFDSLRSRARIFDFLRAEIAPSHKSAL
jgi:hypothetical protein